MIFVFGSNLAGIHGAGAAKYAVEHHGAVRGIGKGVQGNSYALPTKDAQFNVLPLPEIDKYLRELMNYAKIHDKETFLLTPIGTGFAGYTKTDIGKLLHNMHVPKNVVLSREWIRDYYIYD